MRVPVSDLKRHTARYRRELDEAISRVLDSGWFALGPEVERFEAAFADYCGRRYCVGVGSGFDALGLSLRAFDLGAGDEVITSANAGGYGSLAILGTGAKPRFADIDADTLNIAPSMIGSSINSQTRAILVTHLYGQIADMPSLLAIAADRDLLVIEDCAHAHGARRLKNATKAWGNAACFSFYPTKNLGGIGDGGAIVTDEHSVYEKLKCLRQYGWNGRDNAEIAGGSNSRLDEIQAAVLGTKLQYVDGWNSRRREILEIYASSIDHPSLNWPARRGVDHVAHLCVARVKDRDTFRARLRELGVESAVHYSKPDYEQESIASRISPAFKLPNTASATREVTTLPNFPEMTDSEVEHVIYAVRKALG